jgi:hypothetical protein
MMKSAHSQRRNAGLKTSAAARVVPSTARLRASSVGIDCLLQWHREDEACLSSGGINFKPAAVFAGDFAGDVEPQAQPILSR